MDEKGVNVKKIKLATDLILGCGIGYALGMLSEWYSYVFRLGYKCILFASSGEANSGIEVLLLFSRYVNFPFFWVSIAIYALIAILIGKTLYRQNVTIIRALPFLFFLSFVIASFCVPLPTESGVSAFYGTPNLFAMCLLFTVLSTFGFAVLLFISKVSFTFCRWLSTKK